MGFVVDKVALGQVFSEYFGFLWQSPSLAIFIPPISPQSSSLIRGWYSRPVSGRSTQSPTPLIKIKLMLGKFKSLNILPRLKCLG
jgi:hypothetical protein